MGRHLRPDLRLNMKLMGRFAGNRRAAPLHKIFAVEETGVALGLVKGGTYSARMAGYGPWLFAIYVGTPRRHRKIIAPETVPRRTPHTWQKGPRTHNNHKEVAPLHGEQTCRPPSQDVRRGGDG